MAPKTTKPEATDKILAHLVESIKADSIAASPPKRWAIPRLPRLERAIGGGIPRKRAIEIHGPSDAGKSTLVAELVGAVAAAEEEELASPKGRRILVMDHEAVMDLDYMERVSRVPWGHVESMKDIAEVWREFPVIYIIPPWFEFDAQITEYLLRNKRLMLSAHDSFAAMTPKVFVQDKKGAHVDGIEEERPGMAARLFGKWMPKWKKAAVDADAAIIYTNHAKRKSIGHTQSFMPAPWDTVGGENPKFYADIRIRLVGSKSDTHEEGKASAVQVIRNKTSRERNCYFKMHINGDDGFDSSYEWMKIAIETGILQWEDKKGNRVGENSKLAHHLVDADETTYTAEEAAAAVIPGGALNAICREKLPDISLRESKDKE